MKKEGTATITNLEHYHHAENISGLRRSMVNFMNLSFFSNRQLFEPLFMELDNHTRGTMFKPINLDVKVGDKIRYKLKNNKVYIIEKVEEGMANEYCSQDKIKRYFKDNYGLEISENPTDKEYRKMLSVLMKDISELEKEVYEEESENDPYFGTQTIKDTWNLFKEDMKDIKIWIGRVFKKKDYA